MNSIIRNLLTLFIMSSCIEGSDAQDRFVTKNNMEVNWSYSGDRIYFKMVAPTSGWVAIGFNTQDNTSGAYLLMGHIKNEKAEVVEHYTTSPGNYKPVTEHGASAQVSHTAGSEQNGKTLISFSLPIKGLSTYQKNLKPNMEYYLIMAYSREDDFQHHSMMRTSTKIKL